MIEITHSRTTVKAEEAAQVTVATVTKKITDMYQEKMETSRGARSAQYASFLQ